MSELSQVINKLSIVRQIPFFSKLNWFDLNFITGNSSLFEFKKGDIVYKEGAPPDAFYCLVSGRLKAFTQQDDKTEVIEYLYRGQHFGIISLLTGDNHSVTMQAINDSIILKIEKSNFEKILKRIPQLSIDLSQGVSRRLKSKQLHQKTIFESTIICAHSPLAESGSSTYAINLALSLKKETSKKVVLLNINSSAEEVLDVLRIAKDLPSVDLKNITYDNTKIVQQILGHEWGIDLLNVNYDPSYASQREQISLLLSYLSNDYHFIIVDLPNRVDDIIVKVLGQSDFAHFLTLPTEEGLDSLIKVIGRMKSELGEMFLDDKIKIIIRQFETVEEALSYGKISKFLPHDIYATLPVLEYAKDSSRLKPDEVIVIISKPDCEYAKAVRRISREIGKVLVGLALGGGAALGLAHIGVLKVLEKENIPIDVVVGSSIGALIAAIWASGYEAKKIEEIASQFKSKSFAFRLLDFTLPITGLIRGRNLDNLLKRILSDTTFRNTNRTLKIVSYDLRNRQETVIDKGRLIDAVKQSIAIPGVFRPILRSNMMLIDGGVLNPVPTNVLASMGIKKIIAVNTLPDHEDIAETIKNMQERLEKERSASFFRSPLVYIGYWIKKFLNRIFYPSIFDVIVDSFQAVEYLLAQESCRNADIAIHPKQSGIRWFELFQVERLIKNGEAEAARLLPEIKKLVVE